MTEWNYVAESAGGEALFVGIITDEMIEAGAEALDDLLLQLGVEPTYAPDHAPSDTVKRVLARAVLAAAFRKEQRDV